MLKYHVNALSEILDPSIADDRELAETLVKAVGHFPRKQILDYFKDNPPSPRVIYLLMVKAQEALLKERAGKGGKGKAARIAAKKEKPANELRKAWASGKYLTKDICAEQEYTALGFISFGVARDELVGEPNPNPWPAKKPKIK
jgi:hypothetical protein